MKKISLLSILCLSLIFISCRKLLHQDHPYFEPKPNVNCIAVAGKAMEVYVSIAQSFGRDSISRGISDAKIALYEEGVFVENLRFKQRQGIYMSSTVVKEGLTYSLEVDIPKFEKVKCSTTIPIPQRITNVHYFLNGGINDDGKVVPGVRFDFTNQSTERLYYQVVLWYGKYVEDVENEWRTVDIIQIQDPILLNEGVPIFVFSNEKMSDSVYSMYVNHYSLYTLQPDEDTVLFWQYYDFKVELRSIDEAYYRYLKSQYLYEQGRFGSEIGEVNSPYQIYSNIQGGYGIVASYSSYFSPHVSPFLSKKSDSPLKLKRRFNEN